MYGTLDQAGFKQLTAANASSLTSLATALGSRNTKGAVDIGVVYVRGFKPLSGPVTALWFSGTAAAKRAEATLRNGPPSSIDVRWLREARACNVVMTSYNPAADPALARKFDRAVEFMHKNC